MGVITAVSVEELRQAACLNDDSQCDGASSRCTCESDDSDSEVSLPQQKVLQHSSLEKNLI